MILRVPHVREANVGISMVLATIQVSMTKNIDCSAPERDTGPIACIAQIRLVFLIAGNIRFKCYSAKERDNVLQRRRRGKAKRLAHRVSGGYA
jgi:hypothetical protein